MKSLPSPTKRKLFFVNLYAFAACLALAGCSGSKNSPVELESSETGSASTETADEFASIIAEVEAAGGVVDRDKAGSVVGVSFGDVTLKDELAMLVGQLKPLTKISANQSQMTDEGWQALAQLTGLQHLDLRGCNLNNEQLSMMIGNMPDLRSLRLNAKNGASVDDLGLQELRNCPEFKLLAADGLWISVDGLEHIAAPEKMVELYLAKTLMDDEALVKIGEMKNLKKLRLASTSVTAQGLAALTGCPLEELDVSECGQLDDAAMEPISKQTNLKRLNLWRVPITNTGAEQLRELTSMEWLNLDATRIDDDALRYLASMSRLAFLHLGSTGVSDTGMPALSELKSLRDLKVTRTAVTESGAKLITDAIPDIQVQTVYIEGQ